MKHSHSFLICYVKYVYFVRGYVSEFRIKRMCFYVQLCLHFIISFIFTFLKMDRNRVSLTSFAVAMATIVDAKAI